MINPESLHYRTGVIAIDAVAMGVERDRLRSLTPDCTEDDAFKIMSEHRFDVLPIDPGQPNPIKEYFHTETYGIWKPGKIKRSFILATDLLPATTSVEEVIEKFAVSERNFFFLQEESSIVGLLSVSDLNSRQVKLYLFAPLCELEMRLSRFLKSTLSENEIIDNFKEDSRERYLEDKKKDFEHHAIEYTYFSGLINLIKKFKLYQQFGYSRNEFDNFKSLSELRNQIMHAVHPIIRDRESLQKLSQRIKKLKDILVRLRELQDK